MTAEQITMIVPVRNRARLIGETLDMIVRQTVKPGHLVIVDNNSTDGTPGAVKEWIERNSQCDMRIDLLTEPVKGASAARNRGLEAVDTKYVMCFDSDDIMHPTHIECISRELEARPDVELLYFDRMIRDEEMWTRIKSVADRDLIRAQILHCILSTQSYISTAELMRRAGGWNESLPRWNDYELGVRLLIENPVTLKLNTEPSVVIIHREDSISAASLSSDSEVVSQALDAMSESLSRAAAECKDEERGTRLRHALKYVNVRRVVLAALIARENNESIGQQMFDRFTQGLPSGDVSRLRLIYSVVKMLGRGGSALGKMLFRQPVSKGSRRKSSV